MVLAIANKGKEGKKSNINVLLSSQFSYMILQNFMRGLKCKLFCSTFSETVNKMLRLGLKLLVIYEKKIHTFSHIAVKLRQ